jgi:hypothetical protein
MANAPNTGTILELNGQNVTSTGLSTNIIIEVDGVTVGGIQQIQVTEEHDIFMVDEVGTDGHVDSAPRASTNVTGNCRRTRLNRKRIAEAFGRQFIHTHSQRAPFDIVIKDIFGGSDDANTIVTTIKNVWIRRIGYTYTATDFIIVEDMDWAAETIYTTLGNSQNSAVLGGLLKEPPKYTNTIELDADTGGLRGALSAAGLVNELFEPVS